MGPPLYDMLMFWIYFLTFPMLGLAVFIVSILMLSIFIICVDFVIDQIRQIIKNKILPYTWIEERNNVD
jgi:hypothetical protein